MKHLLLFFGCLMLTAQSFSQKPYNKNLQVNDGEFIASGILFGGGTVSVLIGVLSKTGNAFFQSAVRDNSENTAGNTFLVVGAASMLVGSLLYFDARAKQKKRFALSIGLVNGPKYSPAIYSHIPSLSISIPLGK